MLIAGALTAVGLATTFGLKTVLAQSSNSNKSSLVDKISSTFNLDRAEVQKVFDQDRQERNAKQEANFEKRLNSAVAEGKLTKLQADELKSKLAELKKFKEDLKEMSEVERHQALKSKQDELKKWLEENNIPEEYTGFLQAHKHRRH